MIGYKNAMSHIGRVVHECSQYYSYLELWDNPTGPHYTVIDVEIIKNTLWYRLTPLTGEGTIVRKAQPWRKVPKKKEEEK